ncbi:ERF family protein [Solibacillus silvestris]|uniref:ERF family protein n=1 Tax=Solibacillus silvestris TaxID=76853 RepID=UPI003F7EF381
MIFSGSNSEVSAAIAKAWSQIETPKHNATVKVNTKSGGSYSFDYTDLNGIFEAVREVYKEHGIAIVQNSYTEIGQNGLLACVETMFLHSSGEWVKSYALKFPAAGGMQDFGGQITYMKRYSLSAMLGIATEKDDDANGASGNTYDYSKSNSNSGGQRSSVPMPKDAKEAGAIALSFGKHKGKTLSQLWREDNQYIMWLAENEKTDNVIKEAIGMMQVAAAQKQAQQKMEQGA